MDKSPITVAKYLQIRLEQLGLTHLFGIAGNYTAPFLNTIVEDNKTILKIIGDTNEINAGHAADAYARLKGFAAVAVTYGVGAFSLMNPIAGSYVEHCPVLVINGAPTNSDQMRNMAEGLLASHMTGDMYSNINVFRHVTVAAEQVTSSIDAPYKIDAVLNACMIYGRPVYLEVFEDVWRMPCLPPNGLLATKSGKGCFQNGASAAKKVKELIEKFDNPILWAGIEIQRFGLQETFLDFVETTQIEFTTSILGKSVVSEDHPLFRGVFNGNASPINVQEQFEKAGVKIGIGAWTTGKNLGGFDIWAENTVLANHSGIRIGSSYIPNVSLKDFLVSLKEALQNSKFTPHKMYRDIAVTRSMFVIPDKNITNASESPVTFDLFFTRMNAFIDRTHIVIADAGFPLLGAQGIHIAEADGFVCQASWLSIGYSLPASIGVKCAKPDKRPVVFIGDGAFQETCQAISTQNKLYHDTIVFVLDNTIYGIEQLLINPNPFRGKKKIDYVQPDLNDVYTYNNMHPWKYAKLVDVFGGEGFEVNNLGELDEVLKKINAIPKNVIVHVHIPRTDLPESIAYKNNKAGEDEFLHPGWSLC